MRKQRLLAAILSAGLVCGLLSGCDSATETATGESAETVTQAAADGQETADYEPIVMTYLDYADNAEDDNLLLTVIVETIGGTFAASLSGGQISFDGDLEEAADIEVASVNEDKDEAEITLSIPKNDLDVENLDLTANITFASGTILDDNQNALSEEVTAEGSYSTESADKAPTSAKTYKTFEVEKYGVLLALDKGCQDASKLRSDINAWYVDWMGNTAVDDEFENIIFDLGGNYINHSSCAALCRFIVTMQKDLKKEYNKEIKTIYFVNASDAVMDLNFIDGLRKFMKSSSAVKVVQVKEDSSAYLLDMEGVTKENALDKLNEWMENGEIKEVQ